MACLIILRGVIGIGKSSVKDCLIQKLGSDNTFCLNLDQVNEEEFFPMLEKALDAENVVGEMFYGDSHTDNPQWIDGFKDRNFEILSVVLNASYKTGLERFMKSVKHGVFPKSEQFYRDRWNFFNSKRKGFSQKSGIREIEIDTEKISIDETSMMILMESQC